MEGGEGLSSAAKDTLSQGAAMPPFAFDRKAAAAAALCFLAIFLRFLVNWTVNGCVYPAVAGYFGVAREIATAFAVAFFFVLYFVARWKPEWLDVRLLVSVGGGCALSACVLLLVSIAAQDPFGTVVGLTLRVVAQGVSTVLLGLAFCTLREKKLIAASVLGGGVVGSLLVACLPIPDAKVGVVMMCAALVGALFCCYGLANGQLRVLSANSAPADLELLNPYAFIPWRSGLYGCTLLFGIVFGFAVSFEGAGGTFEVDLASPALLACVLLAMLLSRSPDKEDALFSFAALLVVAGLACMPLDPLLPLSFGVTLFDAATSCFGALVWMAVVAVSQRSVFAALPTLCFFNVFQTLGVEMGAVVGHELNGLAVAQPLASTAIVMMALVGFVSFLWLMFRRFSFSETIGNLTRLTMEDSFGQVAVAELPLDEICRDIGDQAGLTNREIEIFALLARGRNGRYIQEKYVISRNTAKTHIRHIYTKLDVHSRQELIDLVDGAKG